MFDGDLLRSFVAFGETRNLTRAARAVGLSQPAFFERIQRLADAVGAPLYERKGRELVLSDAGERMLAFARQQHEQHTAFLAELHGSPVAQRVTLAAGEGVYLYLLGSALAKTRDVELLTLGAPHTIEAVRSGRAHLGIAVLDLVPRGIDSQPIVTTPLCVALPARHRAARARSLRLTELRGERWILPPEGQLHRALASRAIATAGEPPTNVIDADGWPLMLRFVALGLGVAIVNGICKAPGVVLRPLPELGSVTYQLLTRRGAELPAAARTLAASILS